MNKEALEKKLSLVALGEKSLSQEELDFLQKNPELEEYLTETQQILKDLKGLEISDPGELFFKRQFNKITESLKKEKATSSGRFWNWLAVAAVLVLALGIFRLSPWWGSAPNGFMAQQEELEKLELLLVELSPTQESELLGVAPVYTGDTWMDLESLDETELEILIEQLEGEEKA